MKCVKLKGPNKLEVDTIEEPVGKDGNVIIDVKKTGICGSDLHFWNLGQHIDLIPGHEFAGEVIDPGSREDLKVGDKVTAIPFSPCGKCKGCKTGHPQYCDDVWTNAVGLSVDHPGGLAGKLSTRPDLVVKLKDNMTFEEGALIEPTAVGLHAVNLSNIKIGDKVLVIGGGIIGLVSAMFAKEAGAEYVALTETNNLRGENSVKLGVADEWFDAKTPDILETLHKKSEGGFDVVIDCCGNEPTINTALMAVRAGGRIVLVGLSLKPASIPVVALVSREVTIQGVNAYEIKDFQTCIDLISSKKIDVMKFVSDIVTLDEVQKSYERLSSGKDGAVKILVDPHR